MASRSKPEIIENWPKFVEVVFDEKGKSIGARLVKNAPKDDLKNVVLSKQNPDPKPAIPSPPVSNKEYITRVLTFDNKHIEDLRRDIRQSNYYLQQLFQNMKNNGQEKFDDSFLKSIQQMDEKIKNFERLAISQNGFNQTISKKLDQLNVSLDDFSKGMDDLKSSFNLDGQLEDVNLKISGLTKDMEESKTDGVMIAQSIKLFLEKISILSQTINDQFLTKPILEDKFNSIQKEFAAIKERILQNNIQLQNTVSQNNEKLDEISRINEKFDSFRTRTEFSINELKESQNQVRDLLMDQERISRNIANNTILEIQKMFKKPKKRVIKPQKAKVIRFLKKNFKIKPFSKVLVVTDKRNSTFGKTLHEATRRISKKSIFVITENKINKATPDKPVVEAIKKSNYTFIVGKYNLPKLKKIAETSDEVKMVLIKRTLKHSIL